MSEESEIKPAVVPTVDAQPMYPFVRAILRVIEWADYIQVMRTGGTILATTVSVGCEYRVITASLDNPLCSLILIPYGPPGEVHIVAEAMPLGHALTLMWQLSRDDTIRETGGQDDRWPIDQPYAFPEGTRFVNVHEQTLT